MSINRREYQLDFWALYSPVDFAVHPLSPLKMFFSTFFTLMLSLLAAHALAPPDTKIYDQTPVAAGWYQGYQSNDALSLAKISWYKYTHLIYAFA
jgi:hypothetical protein